MIDPISLNSNQQGNNKKKKIPIIILIVFVFVTVIGGILMLRQPKKTEETKVSVVEKKEPSPTEKPKIDKNLVKIQVLNGTGTPGQAGLAVEALKKAGYNPDNIKAANAEDFDNTVTSITAKDGFDDVASDFKDALKTTFDEIKIDSTNLDEDSEFDIIVTTGGKIYEEATPTTNPTNPDVSPTQSPTATITLTPSPTSSPTPPP